MSHFLRRPVDGFYSSFEVHSVCIPVNGPQRLDLVHTERVVPIVFPTNARRS